jgi:HlyD family secretion protein
MHNSLMKPLEVLPSTQDAAEAIMPPPAPHRRIGLSNRAVATAVLMMVASHCVALRLSPIAPAAPTVATVKAYRGMVEHTLRVTGSTVGQDTVTLLAPYLRGNRSHGGGAADFHLVLKELATPGRQVAGGEIVALFDQQPMIDRLDNLRAEQAQAEIALRSLAANFAADREARDQQIRVARAQMEQARLDLQTAPVRTAIQAEILRLAKEEASARYDELQSQEANFGISQRSRFRVAQLAIERAASEVRRAEVNIERTAVRSPRPGLVVIRQTFRNGQFDTIRAGDEIHAGQPYLDIVAPGPMIVEASANQTDTQLLKIGAPAYITPEAFPDIQLTARVLSIGTVAVSTGFRASYVRELPVRLRIDGTNPRILPSLTVSAEIVVGRVEDATLIPRSAVFRDSRDGRPYAIIPTAKGWERKNLELGLGNHRVVAVISGLEHGQAIAVALPAEIGS